MSLKFKHFIQVFKSKKSEYPKEDLEKAYNNLHVSFSQDGEDIALGKMVFDQILPYDGFYVDVGAFHPFVCSNTCLLHLIGWRGINIDANPTSIEKFNELRPSDINVFSGVSKSSGQFKYHIFNFEGINTFCDERKSIMIEKGFELLGSRTVECQRLNTLLDEHLEVGQKIDFLNIDVEGKDEEVCLDFNWEKYMPTVVCIEVLAEDIEALASTSIHKCMKLHDYVLKSYLDMSALYVHRSSLK